MAGPTNAAKPMTSNDFFGDDADDTTPAQVQPPEDPGETEEVPEKPVTAPAAPPEAPTAPVAEPEAPAGTPEAPVAPVDPAAPVAATPEAPIQIPGYPPGVKPPSWKEHEQFRKDSEALAAFKAEQAARDQAAQDERTRFIAQQQYAEQQRQAALDAQRQPQGPWHPQSGRIPSQEEYDAYYDGDPIGAERWMGLYNAQRTNALAQQMAQQAQQNEIDRQQMVFRQQQPDYDRALEFTRDRLVGIAKASFGLSDADALNYVMNEQVPALVARAAQAGLSIPQTAYKMALEYGYTPAQAAQAQQAAEVAVAANPGAVSQGQDALAKVHAAQARQAAQATSIGPTGASVRSAGLPTKAEYESPAFTEEMEAELERVHGPDWMDKMARSWG